MQDFGPRLRKMLSDGGCEFLRQGRGSHEIWWNPSTRKSFSVGIKIKSRHTANEILKQAGLRGQKF